MALHATYIFIKMERWIHQVLKFRHMFPQRRLRAAVFHNLLVPLWMQAPLQLCTPWKPSLTHHAATRISLSVKNEAHTACTCLLAAHPQAASIDVTDGAAFPWQRFLRTQTGTREFVRPGVCRVCVIRRANKPTLAFHRTDGFIFLVTPSSMRTELVRPEEAAQWNPASHAAASWMRLL